MKKLLVLSLLLIAPAIAQAEEITTTLDDIFALNSALVALDRGHQVVIKDGEKQTVVYQPFTLSQNVRVALAKDMFKVTEQVSSVQKEAALLRQNLCKTTCDESVKAQIEEEIRKLGKKEVQVDLVMFNQDELQLEKNTAISPGMLQALRIVLPFLQK